MALKLKPPSEPSPTPFAWDEIPSPSSSTGSSSLPSPPTAWLSARDMKLFGAQPMTATSDIGLVKCNDCDKPILRSFMAEHAVACAQLRVGGKNTGKHKSGADLDDLKKGSKKRKASAEPSDPSLPPKKKSKPATKIMKGRMKGPIDYDQHCGVINDKGLPCSRSLTCKSHSMGAKRAVEGRSRKYDDLLLDWNRAHNPNFVEPVKRETKAEKKEKRDKEKAEKKKLAEEQAVALGVALGVDPSTNKKGSGTGTKKSGKKASAAIRMAAGDDAPENLDDIDSEAELDELVHSVREATAKGIIGAPLAIPCDASAWFVQRRERLRCCRDLLVGALSNSNSNLSMGMGMGSIAGRSSLGMARS
ncbi:unnamed protein product [Mycena citricolor]|uniref:SCA7 domain-containing protein n=1 Tax=Mycena citricolor TaxID=2018698 RepID=A0AAD2H1S2_9AGAR|nr:unnamed protein product [Mycena citricolor]